MAVDSQRLLVAREKPQLKREMINIQKERGKGDLRGLTHKTRHSLNKGLKQFCITSGRVIKHTTKLKGENEGQERGRQKEIPQVELVNSKQGEIMTERERGGKCLL